MKNGMKPFYYLGRMGLFEISNIFWNSWCKKWWSPLEVLTWHRISDKFWLRHGINNDSQLETSPTSQFKYVFFYQLMIPPWLSVSPHFWRSHKIARFHLRKYPISGIDEETQSCSQWNPHWWKTKRYSISLLKPARHFNVKHIHLIPHIDNIHHDIH